MSENFSPDSNEVIYIDNDDIITIERGKSLIIKTIADVEKTSEIRKLEMTLSQLEKKWLSAFYGKRDI